MELGIVDSYSVGGEEVGVVFGARYRMASPDAERGATLATGLVGHDEQGMWTNRVSTTACMYPVRKYQEWIVVAGLVDRPSPHGRPLRDCLKGSPSRPFRQRAFRAPPPPPLDVQLGAVCGADTAPRPTLGREGLDAIFCTAPAGWSGEVSTGSEEGAGPWASGNVSSDLRTVSPRSIRE